MKNWKYNLQMAGIITALVVFAYMTGVVIFSKGDVYLKLLTSGVFFGLVWLAWEIRLELKREGY